MSLLIEVQSQHFMLIKNPSTKEFYVLLSKHKGVPEILMPVCNYCYRYCHNNKKIASNNN